MAWIVFPDEATFSAWHDATCVELGIPFPGETNEEYALDATWTTAAVMPFLVNGQIAALLTDEQIAQDPTLAGLPQITRTPDDVVEPVPFPVAKAIPDLWADPTGTAHTVPRREA